MGIACWTMSRRPSQTREETAKVAPENVDLGDPWPRGFFDCLGDCKACCCGCCCPCYTHAANAVTSKSAPCQSESVCGTCCLFCICQPCCPGYCCLAKPTRLAIRNRYLLEERAAGMGCCDGDCCAKWCCCCCSIIQEARTLAYFEGKGNAYVLSKEGYDAPEEGGDTGPAPGSVAYEENAAKAAERRGDEQRAAKAARNKKASKGGYGHLPPHHPAAVQAANVAKRDKMKEREQTVLQKKCEKRMKKGELWHVIDHAPEFPQPGKKMAMRGPFKRYLDAQRHGVTCDAGMPKWWEVAETSNGAAPGESFCLKFKKRVLRGEGDVGMSVLPEPCSDEWKGIMKGVGKFLLMNEEGLFLKCEKDGSVAMTECNPEDINSFRPFIWETKYK